MTTATTTPAADPLLLSSYTPGQIAFIRWLHANRSALTVFNDCIVSRKELLALCHTNTAYIAVPAWIAAPSSRRAGRGLYRIPEITVDPSTLTVNTNNRGRKAGSRNQKGRVPQTATPTFTPPQTESESA